LRNNREEARKQTNSITIYVINVHSPTIKPFIREQQQKSIKNMSDITVLPNNWILPSQHLLGDPVKHSPYPLLLHPIREVF
jgi:hypothetical protein